MHRTPPTPVLKMGAFARITGCDRETIRYYERIGLLPDPKRTQAGYRVYQEKDSNRLRFILRCRDLGLSIKEVRELIELVDRNEYTCEGVNKLALSHMKSIRSRIRDLQQLEKAIKRMADQCSGGDTPDCAFIDSLFR